MAVWGQVGCAVGCNIQAGSQGSSELNQTPGAELRGSPVSTLLCCLPAPALTGLSRHRLPDAAGNFSKLEPQLFLLAKAC